MKVLSAFCGAVTKSQRMGIYALNLYADHQSFTIPAKTVTMPAGTIANNYIITLIALADMLEALSKHKENVPQTVIFYANDDDIHDDWIEYSQFGTQRMANQCERQWAVIRQRVNKLGITLIVKGSESKVTLINQVQNRKLRFKRCAHD